MDRLISTKGLISKIQRVTGCNFYSAKHIVDSRPTIHAISLDKVKKAREEINSKIESIVGEYKGGTPFEQMPSAKIHRNNARKECIAILDKLIAESEGENESTN